MTQAKLLGYETLKKSSLYSIPQYNLLCTISNHNYMYMYIEIWGTGEKNTFLCVANQWGE